MLNSLTLIITICCLGLIAEMNAQEQWVYFGTRTSGKTGSEGIYRASFDSSTGTLSAPTLAATVENPGFLAIHPTKPLLFAALASNTYGTNPDAPSGGVAAYRLNPADGALTLINIQDGGGENPCHVSIDNTGSFVLIATYRGGTVSSYRIEDDGSLSPAISVIQHEGSSVDPKRQQGPHAHSIYNGPGGNAVYAPDLGMDQVVQYILEDDGILTPNGHGTVPPGSGPRHMSFSADGKFAYCLNEMTNTISAFSIDADTRKLTEISITPTLPADFEARNSSAETIVHPNGKFLYSSNRGHNSIAIYSIDATTGSPTRIDNQMMIGQIPRNFAMDLSGTYMLVGGQKSNTVEVFSVNADTGLLTAHGEPHAVLSPICVRFYPK